MGLMITCASVRQLKRADEGEDVKKILSVACQDMKMKAPIQVWTGFKNRPKDHKAKN